MTNGNGNGETEEDKHPEDNVATKRWRKRGELERWANPEKDPEYEQKQSLRKRLTVWSAKAHMEMFHRPCITSRVGWEKTKAKKDLENRAEQFVQYYNPKDRTFYHEEQLSPPHIVLSATATHSQIRQRIVKDNSMYGFETAGDLYVHVGHGKKPKITASVLAGFYHELGHHVHARRRTGEFVTNFESDWMRQTNTILPNIGSSKGAIQNERIAWEYADPFMTEHRPVQKWFKAYALGTYTGKVKKRTEIL